MFVPPDFTRYRAVSKQVREIFLRHTDLVEPLSLDEAYLDVTQPKTDFSSGTAVAKAIREQIADETKLTASAGVAPNKFLAKIASDWRKPDGLFVIRPHEVEAFLAPLPVSKIPGVGKVMDAKLQALAIHTCADLRRHDVHELERRFGRYGRRLSELAMGIDNRSVDPDQPVQSISSEDTFEHDVTLDDIEPMIRSLAAKTWAATRKTDRVGRTVVLKLKTSDFHILTRSLTPTAPPQSAEEFAHDRGGPARARRAAGTHALPAGRRGPEQFPRLPKSCRRSPRFFEQKKARGVARYRARVRDHGIQGVNGVAWSSVCIGRAAAVTVRIDRRRARQRYK